MADQQVNVVLNAKVTGNGDLTKLRNDIKSAKQEAAAASGRGAPAFSAPAAAASSARKSFVSSGASRAVSAASALSSGGIGGIADLAGGAAESLAGMGAAMGPLAIGAAAVAGAFINMNAQMESANDMANFQIDQGKKELDAKKALLDVTVKFDVGLAKAGISLRNLNAELEDLGREAQRTANFREAGSSVFINATENKKQAIANARDEELAAANAERQAQLQKVYDLKATGRFSEPLAARKIAEIEQASERRVYSANRTAGIETAKAQNEQDTKALAVAKQRAASEKAAADARIAAISKQVDDVGAFYKKRTGVELSGMDLKDLPEYQRQRGFKDAMADLKQKTASELPNIRDVNWSTLWTEFKPGDDEKGFGAAVKGLFENSGPLATVSADNQQRITAWANSNKALLSQIATNQENDKALTDYLANRKALEDAVLKRDADKTSLDNAVAAQQRRASASASALKVAESAPKSPAQQALPFVAPPRPDVNLGGRGRFGLFADGIQSNMHNFASETAKNTGHTVAVLRQILGTMHMNNNHGT